MKTHRPVKPGSLKVEANNHPDAKVSELKFNFNPAKISLTAGGTWENKPNKNKQPVPQFSGSKPLSMELELTFDDGEAARATDLSVSQKVKLLISWTQPTEPSVKKKKPHPPLVRFTWGASVSVTKKSPSWFLAYVESVNVTFTMFDVDGEPTRATVKVGLKEIADDYEKQNPTSGSRVGHDSHLLLQGESLPQLAHRYYEKPALWRGIAAMNGIDDPSRLRPGTRISIPPIEDAIAASH
jgi:hypothetical protein